MRGTLARFAAAAAVAGLALAAAGCGRAAPAKPVHQAVAATVQAPARPSAMVTSVQTTGATWATIPMGATAGPNEFWQLFTRPTGSPSWRLQTPPGIATNGALVLAGTGTTLTAGIRPSIDLTFSPITSTSDEGTSWTTSPPQNGLAGYPDALAAAPDGHLIAAGQDGQISVLAPHSAAWSPLNSKNALARATSCGLTTVTAMAYTPAGIPLVAGTCGRAGTVGIFTEAGSGWRLAGPSLTASLQGQPVQVLRLTRTSSGDVALLQAGSARSASLVAAWTSNGTHWTLSRPLNLAGGSVVSASFGAGNGVAVVLQSSRGAVLAGPGSSWRTLPTLPSAQSVALALPDPGTVEALAASGGTLTVSQLSGQAWAKAQTIKVPIQYGSSSGS